jgi:hypothetical protein
MGLEAWILGTISRVLMCQVIANPDATGMEHWTRNTWSPGAYARLSVLGSNATSCAQVDQHKVVFRACADWWSYLGFAGLLITEADQVR